MKMGVCIYLGHFAPCSISQALKPNRVVFLVARHVPRAEMRSFLAQSEREVVATGDQSVAEAVLLASRPQDADAEIGGPAWLHSWLPALLALLA